VPRGRELNYECTGFSGIKQKNEIWFCVYSVTGKEHSCNNNPLETDIWLEHFLLLWAITWSESFSLWGRERVKVKVPGLYQGRGKGNTVQKKRWVCF
jgi:hypothetical protein